MIFTIEQILLHLIMELRHPMAPMPGFWRGVYRHAFDTDRSHNHGKCLDLQLNLLGGTHNMGPSTHTKDNLVLWTDPQKWCCKRTQTKN